MTSLHASPVYGPVRSRRLGLSVGINLMPGDGKLCTFDCVYCECGYNAERRTRSPRPTRQEVATRLEDTLREMAVAGDQPDVLTFAGNGEPTAHPDFAQIVDDVLSLRERYCPQAKISVLSNGTQLSRPDVFAALMRVDNNIQKLDTADDAYIRLVDRPASPLYRAEDVVRMLMRFGGHVIIQTLFMHGTTGGRSADNVGEEYVAPWLEAIRQIAPRGVMVYTIDRPTPEPTLAKATAAELDSICQRVRSLGISCTASY